MVFALKVNLVFDDLNSTSAEALITSIVEAIDECNGSTIGEF